MDDSKDTVIITGIGIYTSEEDFLLCFSSIGDIKEITLRARRNTQEGIVTYTDHVKATEAVQRFSDTDFKGNFIKVKMAEEYYKHMHQPVDREDICRNIDIEQIKKTSQYRCNGDMNTAWRLWLQEDRDETAERKEDVNINEGLQEDGRYVEVDRNFASRARGGRGGKGGDGFWGHFKGQDGQPGEDGPGGRGGKGRKGGWF